jgi:hypothetical protein
LENEQNMGYYKKVLDENIAKRHDHAVCFEHSNAGKIKKSLKKIKFFEQKIRDIYNDTDS